MIRATALALLASVAACHGSGSGPAGSAPPVEPVVARPDRADAAPDRPEEQPMTDKIDWQIRQGKVGAIELGKRVPDALLAGVEASYVARFIADGQPMDALRFTDPPLLVVLAAGPFAEAAAAGGEPPAVTDGMRTKAAEAVRGGVAVKAVYVEASGPRTEAGVGVGSTLEELVRAYPDLKVSPMPETFGKDTCAGRARSLPGISFVFATCGKAKSGAPVVRVDLL